jgi:hypothetical protein
MDPNTESTLVCELNSFTAATYPASHLWSSLFSEVDVKGSPARLAIEIVSCRQRIEARCLRGNREARASAFLAIAAIYYTLD